MQDEVVRFTHLSLPTIWRLRKGGPFPRPFKIGGRRLLSAELLAEWMNMHHLKIGAMLRELSHQMSMAEQISDPRACPVAKSGMENLERPS